MKILSSYNNGKLTIFLQGELDHHAAHETMNQISLGIEEYLPRSCEIDFSELTFMDSSGIAVILKTHKKMIETGGRATISHVPEQPLRVIDASGIDRIVTVLSPKEMKK